MYAFYSDHFGMWENGIMIVKFCYHEKGNELFWCLFWVIFPIKKLRCFRRSEILNLNPIIWIFLQVLTMSVIPQLQTPQNMVLRSPDLRYSWDESFVNLVLWGCDQMLAVHWRRFDSNFVNARNYDSVARDSLILGSCCCDSTVMWFGVMVPDYRWGIME